MMNRFFTLLLAASCFTAVGQSEYCLEGTIWDENLNGCIPENCSLIADLNNDGLVGQADLLEMLSEYGLYNIDLDEDGVCDAIDNCVGIFDECGVCNGPGPTEVVIDAITTLYDSVYAEQIDQWFVFEAGQDTTFSYTCAPAPCGEPVSYQGYDYATVLIGGQCWFAENLRSENFNNGDGIACNLSNNFPDFEWQNTFSGAMAVYGEGTSPCSPDTSVGDACNKSWSLIEYGRLYNWYTVEDSRGLCPSGWHVPSIDEWTIMTEFLGGVSVAGGKMKTAFGWHNGGNGTNSSGFSGLPGGYRWVNGDFHLAGSRGKWWSSTPNGPSPHTFYLSYDYENAYPSLGNKSEGLSVRCIKDTE